MSTMTQLSMYLLASSSSQPGHFDALVYVATGSRDVDWCTENRTPLEQHGRAMNGSKTRFV